MDVESYMKCGYKGSCGSRPSTANSNRSVLTHHRSKQRAKKKYSEIGKTVAGAGRSVQHNWIDYPSKVDQANDKNAASSGNYAEPLKRAGSEPRATRVLNSHTQN